MARCEHCQGTGVVYLEYVDEFDISEFDREDRWLPCGRCNGSGEEDFMIGCFRWLKWIFYHFAF